ncbi:MAG: hypothetical protein ACI9R3_001095 [Verrucomicrobiales bacterium]|jgi:hypothetical protein
MPDANKPGEYGIARVDARAVRSHGWLVRLQRSGTAYARFFADGRYGDHAAALAAAREFRDSLLEELPQPQRRIRAEQITIRNNSGVIGVCRIVREESNGARYEFWQATWSPAPGTRKTAKFSIKRYGDDGAFELARAAREEAMRELEQ